MMSGIARLSSTNVFSDFIDSELGQLPSYSSNEAYKPRITVEETRTLPSSLAFARNIQALGLRTFESGV
jgi:hypothetical protein